jgi:hypothetical protein
LLQGSYVVDLTNCQVKTFEEVQFWLGVEDECPKSFERPKPRQATIGGVYWGPLWRILRIYPLWGMGLTVIMDFEGSINHRFSSSSNLRKHAKKNTGEETEAAK